jgi:hypothetical protein
MPDYDHLIKTKKHNIGIEEAPKMAIIGYYWDKEIVTQVVDLLKEYEDLFPTQLLRNEWNCRAIGSYENYLNTDAKPVKRRPYRLNPNIRKRCTKN